MDLPVMPPVKPMLAKPAKAVPSADSVEGGFLYEPKWDGFRCLVFRDGDDVELTSRDTKALTRYFPEVVEAVLAQTPRRCVLDGEIVIARGGTLDFDALLQRIHPAASRVALLAAETPASYVAFDLLALGDDEYASRPLAQRRAALERALAAARPPVHVTAATRDPAVAQQWFEVFEGAGLDGVMAKPLAAPYQPDARAMLKVKHERTADCVVAGFRWHKSGPVVGSLLLGLYDEAGALHHVGVSASFPMATRAALVDELEPWRVDSLEGHPWEAWAEAAAQTDGQRRPGGTSRWNAGKDLSWQPLRPERIVEVAYDHMQGDRFRHTARFRRWRDDREAESCTYAQLDRPVRFDLAEVLGAAGTG